MKLISIRGTPSTPPLDYALAKIAKEIGMAYDSTFIVPLTAALLNPKCQLWQSRLMTTTKQEVEMIVEQLWAGTHTVVENYHNVRAIMTDIVYTQGDMKTRRMIILLRKLTQHCHRNDEETNSESEEDRMDLDPDWTP